MRAIIVAIFIVGLAQQQAPESKRGLESHSTADSKQAAKRDNNQTPSTSKAPTTTPALNASPKNQPPPNCIESKANQSAEDIEIQRKIRDFTGMLVFVGVIQGAALLIQAIVLWFTLKQVKRQANTLDEHKGKFEDLAAAAKKNAKAARRAAKVVISKEKPRIIMGEPEGVRFLHAIPFGVDFTLQFSGVTEAYIDETMAVVGIGDSPKDAPDDVKFFPRIHQFPMIINPLKLGDFRATARPTTFVLVEKSTVDEVIKGKKFVHFWGHVKFKDAFFDVSKRQRHFEFHWVWIYYSLEEFGAGDLRGYWRGTAIEKED